MNNLKKFMCGMFAAAMLIGTQAFAQEAETEKNEWIPDVSLEVKYASRYLSKGKVCNPENMLFTDLTLGLKGFYADLWIANDLNRYNADSRIDYEPEEIDYAFGYGFAIEDLSYINSLEFDFCVTYFDYPKRSGWPVVGEQQWEYAAGVNLGILFNPGVKVCWDPETEKWYGNLNCGWDYDFNRDDAIVTIKNLTFNTGLTFWWGNSVFFQPVHKDFDTFTTACWDVSFTYAINEHFSISPFAQLAWAVNHDYRDSWKGAGNPNAASGCNTLWGIKANLNF